MAKFALSQRMLARGTIGRVAAVTRSICKCRASVNEGLRTTSDARRAESR